MSMRTLVAGGFLAVASLLVLPSVAFAADPGTKAGEELVECVEGALHDNEAEIEIEDYQGFETSLEDCSKAKSLITPAIPEIIWGGLAFLIVLVVLMKFAFPALKKGVKAREEKIRSDLEGAEKARLDAQAEGASYQAQLSDARGEANRIVEEAREAANRVRADLVAKAEADAAELRQRAAEDVRLARERAMSDLQSQVGDISIGLAEKIVERNLDPATQRDLVESYINAVGN
ncbi:MAG TPA: F0F1 ATP synthase subunit B [Acidimicrobiia bacterium]|nr:F0F1 ATP synthase subunit B [Acidimicrobiia bacterium]